MNSQIEEILKGISKSRNKDNLEKMFYPDVDISDYFFISYSHKDYRAVYKDLIRLRANNLKIWYDRDVPAGANWKEVVNRYMRPLLCKGVIFYISPNSLKDKETTKQTLAELEYAKQIGKPIIAINLASKVDVGGHKKDVVLSASDMVDELIKEGRNDLIKHKKEISEVFPNDVIYLPITLNPFIRVKKINDSLKECPKLIIDNDFFEFKIVGVSDSTIINLSEADFQKCIYDKLLFNDNDQSFYANQDFIINSCAFSNCQSLEYVSFSSPTTLVNIKELGEYAFSNCSSLVEIYFKNPLLTSLGAGAFYECKKLEKLNGVFKITHPKTFYNCESIKRLRVTSDSIFDDLCFYNCLRLEELQNTGVSAFGRDETPNKKQRIGYRAFYNCQSLKLAPITNAIEEIDDYAFSYCLSLQWAYIGPNIKRVGNGAFDHCISIKTVKIDSPKLDINFNLAFKDCEKLEDIRITENNMEFRVFDGAVYKGNSLVFYPRGSKKVVVQIDENCESIEQHSFILNDYIKEIRIGKNVKSITEAFGGLSELTRITVDKDNKYYASINGVLFDKKLTTVIYIPAKAARKVMMVPDSVTKTESGAFIDAHLTEKIVRKSEVK